MINIFIVILGRSISKDVTRNNVAHFSVAEKVKSLRFAEDLKLLLLFIRKVETLQREIISPEMLLLEFVDGIVFSILIQFPRKLKFWWGVFKDLEYMVVFPFMCIIYPTDFLRTVFVRVTNSDRTF